MQALWCHILACQSRPPRGKTLLSSRANWGKVPGLTPFLHSWIIEEDTSLCHFQPPTFGDARRSSNPPGVRRYKGVEVTRTLAGKNVASPLTRRGQSPGPSGQSPCSWHAGCVTAAVPRPLTPSVSQPRPVSGWFQEGPVLLPPAPPRSAHPPPPRIPVSSPLCCVARCSDGRKENP